MTRVTLGRYEHVDTAFEPATTDSSGSVYRGFRVNMPSRCRRANGTTTERGCERPLEGEQWRPANGDDARLAAEQLRADGWISRATRHLAVVMTFHFNDAGMFVYAIAEWDISPSGIFVPRKGRLQVIADRCDGTCRE